MNLYPFQLKAVLGKKVGWRSFDLTMPEDVNRAATETLKKRYAGLEISGIAGFGGLLIDLTYQL